MTVCETSPLATARKSSVRRKQASSAGTFNAPPYAIFPRQEADAVGVLLVVAGGADDGAELVLFAVVLFGDDDGHQLLAELGVDAGAGHLVHLHHGLAEELLDGEREVLVDEAEGLAGVLAQ